jgi:hypothetical protein
MAGIRVAGRTRYASRYGPLETTAPWVFARALCLTSLVRCTGPALIPACGVERCAGRLPLADPVRRSAHDDGAALPPDWRRRRATRSSSARSTTAMATALATCEAPRRARLHQRRRRDHGSRSWRAVHLVMPVNGRRATMGTTRRTTIASSGTTERTRTFSSSCRGAPPGIAVIVDMVLNHLERPSALSDALGGLVLRIGRGFGGRRRAKRARPLGSGSLVQSLPKRVLLRRLLENA